MDLSGEVDAGPPRPDVPAPDLVDLAAMHVLATSTLATLAAYGADLLIGDTARIHVLGPRRAA